MLDLRPLPHCQLSVNSYFDESLFHKELSHLFFHAPRYVGHNLCVPQLGDFQTLSQEGHGRALIRTAGGTELLSNVCRHRQAVILKGSANNQGNTGAHIVCPLHHWTYDTQGKLVGAPHFEQDPCLNLTRYSTKSWNGLVFETPPLQMRDPSIELAKIACAHDLDFSGYVFHRSEVHECRYNWKTFIEVYLEDYHVGPFHPGLGQFVTCDDLQWEFFDHLSVQTVGLQARLGSAGSPIYEHWHQALDKISHGTQPKHGAIWLTYYPGVMVEWYPHVLVVSTLYPKGTQHTTNVIEFFYPEEIAAFEPDFMAAQQAAYMETCVEDDEIALRMDAGRKALMDRGDNEVGPYQSPMEDGMQHFHQWYRKAMA